MRCRELILSRPMVDAPARPRKLCRFHDVTFGQQHTGLQAKAISTTGRKKPPANPYHDILLSAVLADSGYAELQHLYAVI